MDTIKSKCVLSIDEHRLFKGFIFFVHAFKECITQKMTPPWTASTILPLTSLTTRVRSSLYRIFLWSSPPFWNPLCRAECSRIASLPCYVPRSHVPWLLAVVDHVVASRLLPESCVRFPDTWCAPPCAVRPRASSWPAVYSTLWPPLIFMLDLRFLMMLILVICSCSPS